MGQVCVRAGRRRHAQGALDTRARRRGTAARKGLCQHRPASLSPPSRERSPRSVPPTLSFLYPSSMSHHVSVCVGTCASPAGLWLPRSMEVPGLTAISAVPMAAACRTADNTASTSWARRWGHGAGAGAGAGHSPTPASLWRRAGGICLQRRVQSSHLRAGSHGQDVDGYQRSRSG